MSPHRVLEPPSPIDVDVWIALDDGDCFAAKERIETAVGRFEWPHEVTIRFHALEAGPAPSARPAPSAHPAGGIAASGAEQTDRRSTFEARRLCVLALGMGGPALLSALVERLYVAFFRENTAIDDPASLLRLAAEAGLDEHEVASVLAGSGCSDEVHADEATAVEQGVTGVPCVVAGRSMLSGPGTIDEYLTLLREAGGLLDTAESLG